MEAMMAAAMVGQGLMQAKAAKSAAAFERAQYEEERQTALLQSKQEENARRRELRSILATQDAIRGGRGTELFSATGKTIKRASTEAAERDIGAIRLNGLSKARRYGLAGQQASAQGKYSAMSSIMGGIGGAMSSANGFGGGKGTTTAQNTYTPRATI